MIEINLLPTSALNAAFNAYKRAWRRARRADPVKAAADRAAKREAYARVMADPIKRETFRAAERARYKTTREDPIKLERQRALARRRRGSLETPSRPDDVRCAICSKRPGIHADHDHSTGFFRGWLCSNCNTALGLLGDDCARMLGAMVYLLASQSQ